MEEKNMITDKHVFYVGVDLSTNIIGIAIVYKPENIIFTKDIHLKRWDSELSTIIDNHEILQNMVLQAYSTISTIAKKLGIVVYRIHVGIELSNFSNPKITQRFSKYYGIIETYFLRYFGSKIEAIKAFNANEWFRHLHREMKIEMPLIKLQRSIRKMLAKDFLKTKQENNYKADYMPSEDEADAFCIAWYVKFCRTTEAIAEQVSDREILETKIRRLNKKIKKEEMKQKLNGKINTKKIDNVKEQIKIYTKELENGKYN